MSHAAAAIPEARAVLEEAAYQLVLSSEFDTCRRALSPRLGPGAYLTGEEVEGILLERSITGPPTGGEPSGKETSGR